MKVIEEWHPDTNGTGMCLIEKLKHECPQFFDTTPEIQGDLEHVLLSFKTSLSCNKLIGDEPARVALISLARTAFPKITKTQLRDHLGVTENDIRKSSRFEGIHYYTFYVTLCILLKKSS